MNESRNLEEIDQSQHRLKNEKENPSGCNYAGAEDLMKRIEAVVLTDN